MPYFAFRNIYYNSDNVSVIYNISNISYVNNTSLKLDKINYSFINIPYMCILYYKFIVDNEITYLRNTTYCIYEGEIWNYLIIDAYYPLPYANNIQLLMGDINTPIELAYQKLCIADYKSGEYYLNLAKSMNHPDADLHICIKHPKYVYGSNLYINELTRIANNGNTWAMIYLSNYYLENFDKFNQFKWLKQAADGGNVYAMYCIGSMTYRITTYNIMLKYLLMAISSDYSKIYKAINFDEIYEYHIPNCGFYKNTINMIILRRINMSDELYNKFIISANDSEILIHKIGN